MRLHSLRYYRPSTRFRAQAGSKLSAAQERHPEKAAVVAQVGAYTSPVEPAPTN